MAEVINFTVGFHAVGAKIKPALLTVAYAKRLKFKLPNGRHFLCKLMRSVPYIMSWVEGLYIIQECPFANALHVQ
jgi:hypothetical protein